MYAAEGAASLSRSRKDSMLLMSVEGDSVGTLENLGKKGASSKLKKASSAAAQYCIRATLMSVGKYWLGADKSLCFLGKGPNNPPHSFFVKSPFSFISVYPFNIR